MRWVVGDLHGCLEELDALLESVRFVPDHDQLWCLGDLVGRGPSSLGVLRRWKALDARGVLGNHDLELLRAAAGRATAPPEVAPVLAAPDAGELLQALRELPVLAPLPGGMGDTGVWLVHAGLHPHWRDLEATAAALHAGRGEVDWLDSAGVHYATTVRCCDTRGDLVTHKGTASACPPPSRPWDEFWQGPELVVHGHWSLRGIYRGRHALGLDSGCVHGGSLTAWSPDADCIVQIPSRQRRR